jgi:hypothetical protein
VVGAIEFLSGRFPETVQGIRDYLSANKNEFTRKYGHEAAQERYAEFKRTGQLPPPTEEEIAFAASFLPGPIALQGKGLAGILKSGSPAAKKAAKKEVLKLLSPSESYSSKSTSRLYNILSDARKGKTSLTPQEIVSIQEILGKRRTSSLTRIPAGADIGGRTDRNLRVPFSEVSTGQLYNLRSKVKQGKTSLTAEEIAEIDAVLESRRIGVGSEEFSRRIKEGIKRRKGKEQLPVEIAEPTVPKELPSSIEKDLPFEMSRKTLSELESIAGNKRIKQDVRLAARRELINRRLGGDEGGSAGAAKSPRLKFFDADYDAKTTDNIAAIRQLVEERKDTLAHIQPKLIQTVADQSHIELRRLADSENNDALKKMLTGFADTLFHTNTPTLRKLIENIEGGKSLIDVDDPVVQMNSLMSRLGNEQPMTQEQEEVSFVERGGTTKYGFTTEQSTPLEIYLSRLPDAAFEQLKKQNPFGEAGKKALAKESSNRKAFGKGSAGAAGAPGSEGFEAANLKRAGLPAPSEFDTAGITQEDSNRMADFFSASGVPPTMPTYNYDNKTLQKMDSEELQSFRKFLLGDQEDLITKKQEFLENPENDPSSRRFGMTNQIFDAALKKFSDTDESVMEILKGRSQTVAGFEADTATAQRLTRVIEASGFLVRSLKAPDPGMFIQSKDGGRVAEVREAGGRPDIFELYVASRAGGRMLPVKEFYPSINAALSSFITKMGNIE